MISYIFGLPLLAAGLALLWSLIHGSKTTTRRRRGADPNYFKSMEITLPERVSAKAWTTPARSAESFDFSFSDEEEKEIKPIGLAEPTAIPSTEIDPAINPRRTGGIGFEDQRRGDDDPEQGTLGF